MIIVVDASVAVSWYLKESYTAEAEVLISGRFKLHAPELILAEFGNVLWKKCRNDDLDENTAESALRSFQKQKISLHSHIDLLGAAYYGAMKTGQSVYDWIYLALAISLDGQFVTADRKFYIGLRNTPYSRYIVWIENVITLI